MASPSLQPILHYLDIGRLGRGEVVRLFLKDAGLDFQDNRYAYDESWAVTSLDLQKRGVTITGKVPVLEYNGTILSQHLPILRYLSRELKSYDGQTSLEKYLVDAVADIYNDWRFQWVANLKNPTDDYKNKVVPEYYNVLSRHYNDRGGPFLLGTRITYADFAVYQSIDNDERTGTLTQLPETFTKLREAVEARPRIAAYIAKNRHDKT